MPPSGEVNSPLQHQTVPRPIHGLHCESEDFVVTCKSFAALFLEWLFYRPGRNPGAKASVYLIELLSANFTGRSSELAASGDQAEGVKHHEPTTHPPNAV
jgi:hypothetical protein